MVIGVHYLSTVKPSEELKQSHKKIVYHNDESLFGFFFVFRKFFIYTGFVFVSKNTNKNVSDCFKHYVFVTNRYSSGF